MAKSHATKKPPPKKKSKAAKKKGEKMRRSISRWQLTFSMKQFYTNSLYIV
jgi:hypothetical protein